MVKNFSSETEVFYDLRLSSRSDRKRQIQKRMNMGKEEKKRKGHSYAEKIADSNKQTG